jgi:hypothetical protein
MTYEVRSAHRAVALNTAESAQEALLDYLRAIGCRDVHEIVRLGDDAAVWRGARFEAVPATRNAESTVLVGDRS